MNDNLNLPEVELYSDGGAVPNPGRGGYGVILSYKGIKKEFSKGYKKSTNNRMELTGVIVGLSKLKQKSRVQVYTDSQYTINGIKKGWAEKWRSNNWYRTKNKKALNSDLWEKLLLLLDKHDVSFNWVKGHNGHKENERCDELATLALNNKNLIEDEGFEDNEI
ncbi:ribonuclease HI [Candidatus Gracilibacteria bacterium]|nr:MAG: ribonuclease HI [Candidatus Gracilibacteria bacterium]